MGKQLDNIPFQLMVTEMRQLDNILFQLKVWEMKQLDKTLFQLKVWEMQPTQSFPGPGGAIGNETTGNFPTGGELFPTPGLGEGTGNDTTGQFPVASKEQGNGTGSPANNG